MRFKYLAVGTAFAILAVGVTACGKRGPLDPPPATKTTAEAEKTAAEDGRVIEERDKAAKKEHEPFILDVLL